jgi:hypothetical protein
MPHLVWDTFHQAKRLFLLRMTPEPIQKTRCSRSQESSPNGNVVPGEPVPRCGTHTNQPDLIVLEITKKNPRSGAHTLTPNPTDSVIYTANPCGPVSIGPRPLVLLLRAAK